MRFFVCLLLFFSLFSLIFAATGFDYPTPTTLRLFNDATIPFCIDTVSGVQLDNCGNEWANSTWCVSYRRNANPWERRCVSELPFTYRVASDNLTYANVTFHTNVPNAGILIVNYNLTQWQPYLSVQPNFTITSNIPSNTTGRFSIITRDIKINNTVENDTAWFDNKNYSLALNTTTNNTANTTTSNTFVLYDWQDQQQIFYSWEQKYPTKLDVWPQPGYGNRQTNLTWELGLIKGGKSYVVPMTWNDLELNCDVGTSVISVTVTNNASANVSAHHRANITASIIKSGPGSCTFYLYYTPMQGQKYGLMPSTFTNSKIDLPVGITVGTPSQVTTAANSVTWTVLFGGQNSTSPYLGNFSYWVNVSGVRDTGIAGYLKYFQVWDTKPPNATINTSNWTNYTDGNIRIFAFATDETNMRSVELWSNETGTWKYTDKQNTSTSAINKTIAFNFTRTFSNLVTQCYLYGITAKDTTYDNYTNKWNTTRNVTLCVNLTLAQSQVNLLKIILPQKNDFDKNSKFNKAAVANYFMLEPVIALAALVFLFAYLYTQNQKRDERLETFSEKTFATIRGIVYFFFMLFTIYTLIWMAFNTKTTTERTELGVFQNQTKTSNASECLGGFVDPTDWKCDFSNVSSNLFNQTYATNTIKNETSTVQIGTSVTEKTYLSDDTRFALASYLDAYTWVLYLLIVGFILILLFGFLEMLGKMKPKRGI